MKFRDSVEQTPGLQGAWRAGLQALSGADKAHVTAEDTSRLTGSVNVDVALARSRPNDARLDYAVGHRPKNRNRERVYWIEVQSASSGHIDRILAKFQWLQEWLENSAPRLWPDFLLQVSPSYARTATVDDLAARGMLHTAAADVFRTPGGQPFHLYQHQVEAMDLASTGQSFVVTSGTGSGKSLTYFLPIIDSLLRQPATGDRVAALVV